jgi:hypothetical protein
MKYRVFQPKYRMFQKMSKNSKFLDLAIFSVFLFYYLVLLSKSSVLEEEQDHHHLEEGLGHQGELGEQQGGCWPKLTLTSNRLSSIASVHIII